MESMCYITFALLSRYFLNMSQGLIVLFFLLYKKLYL